MKKIPPAKICTLVFLRRNDEILLAMKKRGFGAGKWNGAGGKVEPNESIEQGMVREAQEEICVTPHAFRKIAVQHFRGITKTGEVWENISHTFICEAWEGEPRESEEMSPRWFSIAKIPYANMWEDDALWLPLVLKGKLLHSTFTFDASDNMLSADIRIVTDLADET